MSEGSDERGFGDVVAAAHELKTPLSIISYLAASLEEEDGDLSPVERRVAVERIRLSAERTLRLVQGLTVGYRLESQGQLALGFGLEPLNARQVCEEVAHEIGPLAKAHGQMIELWQGAGQQLVVGNRDLLRGVFFNLMDNAIRHNPANAAVSVRLRRRGGTVRVCVQDSGPGLAAGDLLRLRQTLGRQLQPLGGRSGSSGLGLYIAGQMADAMGGRLGLGRVQTGADFHVDLLHSKQLSFLP